MAITFVGNGGGNSASGAISVFTPSNLQTNDLLITLIETANDGSQSVPSGWTTLTSFGTGSAGGTSSTKIWAYWKWASSSEPTTYSFGSASAANHRYGVMLAFRGVDLTTPFNSTISTNSGSGTSWSIYNQTNSDENSLVLYAIAQGEDRNAGVTPSINNSGYPLIGVQTYFDGGTATGSGGGVAAIGGFIDYPNSSFSTYGNFAQTTNSYAVLGIVIRPATVLNSTRTYLKANSSVSAPSGATSALVECWGGGAGGGSSTTSTNKGAGGGGGAYSAKTIPVTGGTSYDYNVGIGGPGGFSGSAGSSGGDTWFASPTTVMAKGGQNYNGGDASASIGDVRASGGRAGLGGYDGGSTSPDSGGGVSAGSADGITATPGTNDRSGIITPSVAPNGVNSGLGMSPGGGGSGTSSTYGGQGYPGQIRVTWFGSEGQVIDTTKFFAFF